MFFHTFYVEPLLCGHLAQIALPFGRTQGQKLAKREFFLNLLDHQILFHGPGHLRLNLDGSPKFECLDHFGLDFCGVKLFGDLKFCDLDFEVFL